MKKYIIKKKITKIVVCLIIDITIILIWSLFISYSMYLSESAKKLSISIMCICMLIPIWKLKIWTVFTERVIEGKITYIKKSTSENFGYTGVNPGRQFIIGLSSVREKSGVYGYYIVYEDKKEKKHDLTLEYTDNAHIFPYRIGNRIIKFPYIAFPQIEDENRTVCIFCGMPVNKNDMNDKRCHYCGKEIIKKY